MSVAAVTFTDSDSSSRPPTCRHPPTSRRRAGPRPSGLAGRPAYWRSYVTSKQLPCAPRARACGICIFPPRRRHGGSSSSNRTRSRGQGSRQSATRHGRVDAAVTRHFPPPPPQKSPSRTCRMVNVHTHYPGASLGTGWTTLYHGCMRTKFSHAGPVTWNALPDHIRTVADPVKFRKLLKSHNFSQAFNTC